MAYGILCPLASPHGQRGLKLVQGNFADFPRLLQESGERLATFSGNVPHLFWNVNHVIPNIRVLEATLLEALNSNYGPAGYVAFPMLCGSARPLCHGLLADLGEVLGTCCWVSMDRLKG